MSEVRFYSDIKDLGEIKMPELKPGDEFIHVSTTHSDGGVAWRKLHDDIAAMEASKANVFALPGSQEVLQPGWFSMKKIPEHGEPGHQSGACGKCNSKD